MKQRFIVLGIILMILGGVLLVWLSIENNTNTKVGSASALSIDELALPSIGFQKVDGERAWRFPEDFGPHPDFQREQWHLRSEDGCPINIDILLERVSVVPPQFAPMRRSNWATQSIFTAHAVLQQAETILLDHVLTSRGANNLAAASLEQVWVENWVLDFVENSLNIQEGNVVLKGELVFGNPQEPMADDLWYSYQRPIAFSGQLITQDADTKFDCNMVLLHRFGSGT